MKIKQGIVLIGIVGILIAGAVVIFKFPLQKQESIVNVAVPQDWKLLENDVYGNFKYPADFISKVTPTPEFVSPFEDKVKIGFVLMQKSAFDSGKDYPHISVVVYDKDETALQQLAQEDMKNQVKQASSVNPKQATVRISKIDSSAYKAGIITGEMGAYYIQHNDVVYRIFWIGNQDYGRIANIIRASLIFIPR